MSLQTVRRTGNDGTGIASFDLIKSRIPHATGIIPHPRPVADSLRLSSSMAAEFGEG